MINKADCITHYTRSEGPVSYALAYSPYLCVPHLALKGMPLWWQRLFVWLLGMLPETPEYTVQRRDERGKFVKDPWVNYRHGSVQDLINQEAGHV